MRFLDLSSKDSIFGLHIMQLQTICVSIYLSSVWILDSHFTFQDLHVSCLNNHFFFLIGVGSCKPV